MEAAALIGWSTRYTNYHSATEWEPCRDSDGEVIDGPSSKAASLSRARCLGVTTTCSLGPGYERCRALRTAGQAGPDGSPNVQELSL